MLQQIVIGPVLAGMPEQVVLGAIFCYRPASVQ